MYAPDKGALGKPAIGRSDDVLSADKIRKPHNTFADQLRMFHDVGDMTNDARNESAAFRKFDALPDAPFMFVSWMNPKTQDR